MDQYSAPGSGVPPDLSPPPIAPQGAQPQPVMPPRRSDKRRGFGCVLVAILALFGCVAVIAVAAALVWTGTTDVLTTGAMLADGSDQKVLEEIIQGAGLETEKKVAVIDVKGIILPGGGFDMAGSRRISYELAAARRDPNVVAIVLDMDTPGGEVTASDEIHRDVRKCSKAGIPVVTCMRSIGASGGYFVAAGSDWIIASRLTITGSIGVIISTTNYSGLFEKVGIEAEVYKSGQMKDMLRGSRVRTDMERAYVQSLVDGTFREFATVVANGRTRYDTAEDVMQSEFGDGRIVTGAEALRLGLVDQLGYFEDALAKAKELANTPIAKVVRYRRPFRLSDLLLGVTAHESAGLRSLLPPEVQAVRPGRLYFLMPGILP